MKLINGKKDIDSNYGIQVKGDEWKMGDKSVEIKIDILIINNVRYQGTRGLYELIFMNHPNEYIYTKEDLDNYSSILLDTNVHRIDFQPNGRIKSKKGHKYKNIIKESIRRKPRGVMESAMMETYADDSLSNIPSTSGSGITLPAAYVKPSVMYFDDPNEIVDRLRLLISSEQAGNTGHKNEINEYMKELFEIKDELLNNVD